MRKVECAKLSEIEVTNNCGNSKIKIKNIVFVRSAPRWIFGQVSKQELLSIEREIRGDRETTHKVCAQIKQAQA